MSVRVFKGNIVTTESVLENGVIVVENGVIQSVDAKRTTAVTDDFSGAFIAPGLIDIHTHGIGGSDTMDASVEALDNIAKHLAAHGVTGFLPTTVTQSLSSTTDAIARVCDFMETQRKGRGAGAGSHAAAEQSARATALGIHLEGPWLSKLAKGAQNDAFIVPPEEATIRKVVADAHGAIKVITIAPEVPGAMEIVKLLCDAGVYVSVGHTVATYEQALAAFDAGASHVTHCFNAMTGLHHRKPGVVGAAISRSDVYAELIADGIHVHPEMMKLLIRNKGRERVVLVSDSIAAADMPEGAYSLGGLDVHVEAGSARLADGTLAGSTLTLDRAVRTLVTHCNVSLADAVYMAATTPAEAIGLGEHLGKIAPGYTANFAVLDATLQPIQTIIA